MLDLCLLAGNGVRRKISMGEFIQWHMVDIFIWCTLFVTSYDITINMPVPLGISVLPLRDLGQQL